MDPYPIWIPIAALALLSVLLAAGRAALTALPDSAVKKMASSDDGRERLVASLLARPSALYDGTALAIFSCLTALSILLWRALSGILNVPRLRGLLQSGPLPGLLYAGALFFSFAVMVLVLDVVCNLLPARIAGRFPLQFSLPLVRLCRAVSIIFRPFVLLNGALAGLFARLFGVHPGEEPDGVTEEEIRMLVDVGNEKGAIEKSEKDMINNIFEFDDRCVSEVMTHRTDMIAVPADASLDAVVNLAIETGYSRLPVYEDNIDSVIGILYVKDLLCLIGKPDAAFYTRKHMRRVFFVPENMRCVDLFAQFKQKKLQVAVAVDEYGGTAGIVSMEDLLESIVGNIQDEYDDEEEEVFPLGKNAFLLDGTLAIDDVERLFDVTLDEEDESDYDTIGGLLTDLLEGLPEPDEHPTIEVAGIRFTVMQVAERRIARIRAERLAPAQPAADQNKMEK